MILIDFDGLSTLQGQFNAAPQVIDRAINSALKSALYHIRLKLKSAVVENEFGWTRQKPFPTGIQMLSLSRRQKRARDGWNNPTYQKDRPFFGKLGKLMFYNYDEKIYSGEVGAVDAEGQNKIGEKGKTIWRKLQLGYSTPVVPGMRRMFAAMGFPIKNSTSIFQIPARPLFGPVASKRADEVRTLINVVIADKISNGFKHSDIFDNIFG